MLMMENLNILFKSILYVKEIDMNCMPKIFVTWCDVSLGIELLDPILAGSRECIYASISLNAHYFLNLFINCTNVLVVIHFNVNILLKILLRYSSYKSFRFLIIEN